MGIVLGQVTHFAVGHPAHLLSLYERRFRRRHNLSEAVIVGDPATGSTSRATHRVVSGTGAERSWRLTGGSRLEVVGTPGSSFSRPREKDPAPDVIPRAHVVARSDDATFD